MSLLENVPGVQCLTPIILHLAKLSDETAHRAAMSEADVILTQNTADSFRVSYLRSSNIKAIYPNTLVWPNVFYSGQQPFLRYFTHPDQGRMMGPLEALHDLRLFSQWGLERGVFTSASIDEHAFAAQVKKVSLSQLRIRESDCDVSISDFIQHRLCTDKLFFTFNHPTRLVLAELATRITKKLNLETVDSLGEESLNRYIVPSLWPTDRCGGTENVYQGDNYQLREGGMVERLQGPPREYSPTELTNAFFEVYDHNLAFLQPEAIRFTPNYDFDPEYYCVDHSGLAS